jgi:hypothetical protein
MDASNFIPPLGIEGTGVFMLDDAYVCFSKDALANDAIVKRTIAGTSDIIYTEATSPHVRFKSASSFLFTGP